MEDFEDEQLPPGARIREGRAKGRTATAPLEEGDGGEVMSTKCLRSAAIETWDLYKYHEVPSITHIGDSCNLFLHLAKGGLESNLGRMYLTWSEGIPFNRYRSDFGIQRI